MKNQIKTILLLGVLSAVLISLGGVLGRGYLYLFLGMAVVINFISYFFSDRIVLKMSRAREVPPQEAPWLHAMVEELAFSAGIPKPRLYMIPEGQPNAFATGRNPQNGVVAVTEGIVRTLDRNELRGVLAHELAHIRNRDILVATVAAGIAAAVSYIGQALQFAAIFGGGQNSEGEDRGSAAGSLVMAFVAPIVAMMLQMAVSRSREYLADETAAKITGDPVSLARALEKLQRGAQLVPANVQPATASLFIVNPFTGGRTLMHLFSTHPPMEKRIERLLAMAGRDMRRELVFQS